MKLLNAVAFVAFQFAFASPASALEAQPGDACPVVGRYTFSGGPELSGVTHQMVCNASNVWSSILDNDAAGNAALAHAVSLTGDISPSQITTNQNDYSPAGLSTASVLRLNSDASRNVTSLAGGSDGRIVTVMNVGSNPIVLKNDDGATGTAANRFALTGDLTLAAKQSAMLMYDSTASRWRQIANGTATGAAAAAGGSNTQVQYNNSGTLAGDAAFTYTNTAGVSVLTLGTTQIASGAAYANLQDDGWGNTYLTSTRADGLGKIYLNLGTANSTSDAAFVIDGNTGENTSVLSFVAESALRLSGDITPAQITANQNNYNPTGLVDASVLRLSSNASRNITSLAGGADGRVITLMNVGSFPIVLKNDDGATGTAANRFALTGDLTLAAKQSAMLMYDSTASRWRQIANGTATGSGDNLGNHTATANIQLGSYWLSGDGGNEGLFVENDGNGGLVSNNGNAAFIITSPLSDANTAIALRSRGSGMDREAAVWADQAGALHLKTNTFGDAILFDDGNGTSVGAFTSTRFENKVATLISGDISPAQITANQNDYNPASLATASVLRLNSNASRNITSLAGGADGRIITVMNVGSFPIVLKNDDGATGTAANRFALTGDLTLAAKQSAMLMYDSTASRWRQIANGTATGSGDNLGNHTATANVQLGSYWLSGDGGNEGIRVDSSGRIGIGAAPGGLASLEITPTGVFDGMLVNRIGAGTTNAGGWGIFVANAGGTDYLNFGQTSSTYTTGGPTAWAGNDKTVLYYPTELRIGTNPAAAAPVMTMTSAGNVGIGTAAPATALDVNGDITSRNITSCTQLGTDSAGKIVCQGTAVAPMVLISTQTASGSASLQFTALPTTYNTMLLNCAGLLLSADAGIRVQVGQGAGPTWNTSAKYSVSSIYTATGFTGSANTYNSSTDNDLTGQALFTDTASPMSLKMYIDNISSSSIAKVATFHSSGSKDSPASSYGVYTINGMGFWNNDTNPVTAIRLITTGGTMTSGTCSLYGMN